MASKEPDHYTLLGLQRDAKFEEIQAAWKRVAKELHPDRNPSPDAEKMFIVAKRASLVLLDPDQRAKYDLSLIPASLSAFASGSRPTSRKTSAPSHFDSKKALQELEEREREAASKRRRKNDFEQNSKAVPVYDVSTPHAAHPTTSNRSSSSPHETIEIRDDTDFEAKSFDPTMDQRRMTFEEYEQFVINRLDNFIAVTTPTTTIKL